MSEGRVNDLLIWRRPHEFPSIIREFRPLGIYVDVERLSLCQRNFVAVYASIRFKELLSLAAQYQSFNQVFYMIDMRIYVVITF